MFKKFAAAASVLVAGVAHAFVPQAGTWAVTSELNGQPGRGMTVDVQNGVLALTMYAYDSSGKGTFYQATGPIVGNKVSADLLQFEGGRYFGSGPRSGTQKGNAGRMTVRFVDGVSGFITFPGEQEVAISRFNFGYPADPSGLRGAWLMTTGTTASNTWISEVVDLQITGSSTANGNGLISTRDGRFGCEQQVGGNAAGWVMCVKITASGALDKVYIYRYSVNEGEGDWQSAQSNTAYALYTKRLIDKSGTVTGLLRNLRQQEEQQPDLRPLLEHLSAVAAQIEPR
ncbi:hypothetical protein [Xylophilus sp. ASV27]|uniref:hypothetical protein n=1 Tax=Xylophilus sp. ASV27 TaxID=2795129 RepID=UPI0018EB9EA1|nr:hypothetical protein [Xylophilus sp. ASV27]